jgi:hypothetical protein
MESVVCQPSLREVVPACIEKFFLQKGIPMALKKTPLKKAQIGRCGELLVQYLLLSRGIESAPMTTDSGIDLVAYAPTNAIAMTIQVKTNLQAKPSGGKGKLGLDWWIADDNSAQIVALVDLFSKQVWLFTHNEIATLAQQHSSGRYHIFVSTDPTYKPKKINRLAHLHEFAKYSLEVRVHELFDH